MTPKFKGRHQWKRVGLLEDYNEHSIQMIGTLDSPKQIEPYINKTQIKTSI